MSRSYIALGLTALVNNAQAGAYAINVNQETSQFTTCTALANSCILPANIPAGTKFTIILDSSVAHPLNIFPPVGGEINDLVADNALQITAGSRVQLISSNSNKYLTILNESPSVINTVSVFADPLDIDTTVSGRVITIPNAGGTRDITLPAVATSTGINCTLICSGAVTNGNHVTITAPANTIKGYIVDGTGIQNCAGTTIQLGNGTGAMAIGDQIRFVCDGTYWYASGIVADRTHLTVA